MQNNQKKINQLREAQTREKKGKGTNQRTTMDSSSCWASAMIRSNCCSLVTGTRSIDVGASCSSSPIEEENSFSTPLQAVAKAMVSCERRENREMAIDLEVEEGVGVGFRVTRKREHR